MRKDDIDLLCCKQCHGNLYIFISDHNDANKNHIVNGALRCKNCKRIYPILNHVLIFLDDEEIRQIFTEDQKQNLFNIIGKYNFLEAGHIESEQLRVGHNWNFQFTDAFPVSISDMNLLNGFWGENAFYNFSGITKDVVRNKIVGVFCGGSGREAYHLLNAGARKAVVVDIGGHINNLPFLFKDKLDNVLLLWGDIKTVPLKNECLDIVICDHALQHVENHRIAFSKMVQTIKPQEEISICVYSHENNLLMTHAIEPLKFLFKIIPVKILRYFAIIPAFMLFMYFHINHSLFKLGLIECTRLPFFKVLNLWSYGGFQKFWEACFDLLHAPISYHFKKFECENLAQKNNLKIVKIDMVNDTMWCLVAQKGVRVPCESNV